MVNLALALNPEMCEILRVMNAAMGCGRVGVGMMANMNAAELIEARKAELTAEANAWSGMIRRDERICVKAIDTKKQLGPNCYIRSVHSDKIAVRVWSVFGQLIETIELLKPNAQARLNRYLAA